MTPEERADRIKKDRLFWQEHCKAGNPANVEWMRRWNREYAHRWEVGKDGKYRPRVKP